LDQISNFPAEADIIADALEATFPETTIDIRRFAEQYVRRRRLAEKGEFADKDFASARFGDDSPLPKTLASSAGNSSGGWNEVAKRGPPKEQPEASSAAFKVVTGKKKGKK
jgi:PERQ amino acid-rich with GYF domain-containing protein